MQYVGPGASAVRVQLDTAPRRIVGGTTVPLRANVYDAGGVVMTGVPIGYRLSDSTRGTILYPTPFTATLTASPAVRDSVWLVAETPTHLKDSARVQIVPPAASLAKISGDNQTGIIGAALKAPLVVRVLDALNGGFKGDTVRWNVTTANATLSAAFSVSDDTGYATVSATPTALGTVTVQAAVTGLQGSPQTFTATATAGTVKQVIISPKLDTIARGTTLQYTAVAKDSLGNVVSTPFNWTSTVPTIAKIDASGLAMALAGDSTKIIAAAGSGADTARLYVRALRTVTVAPADTIVTAVGDSLQLRVAHFDNFGAAVTTGFTTKYISASPTVVSVDATGKVKSTGPGNGVVVVRDSVDSLLKVQASATIRVNQVTRTIFNRPGDSVTVGASGQITVVLRGSDSAVVGVSGQTQIVAVALDSNGYKIPGKTFGWASRNTATATVSTTGIVSGVALGVAYVADSVDGFLDSTRVTVVAAPPKQIQWTFDSTSVGNGGNVSIGLTVTQPPSAALTISIASSDTTIAKASPNTVTIGAGASATSAVIYGLRTGRAVLTASDVSGQSYASRNMTVGVVSTINFREIASPCCQQQYFYLNQNETHKAQVWLSDPAPTGGLGITFIYAKGLTAVTPSPAIIPAGQLSADIVFQGLKPGASGVPDSVVPTSGGYVGKFSYVYVAPDSLRLYTYPGTLGAGQYFQPYVQFTYAMDHPLVVSTRLSPLLGTTPDTVTIPTGTTYGYFTVAAKSAGADTLTVSAPGWVSATSVLTFTTPRLRIFGTTSLVAGAPNGYWYALTQDSVGYGHSVVDTVTVTVTSRNPNPLGGIPAIAIDTSTAKVLPGNSGTSVRYSLRPLATAGGDSAWIVATALGYFADSMKVYVTKPTLTLTMSYPSTVGIGTIFQNAGYVSIPYPRPDTFTVVFGHSRRGIVSGPDSVSIPKGQTYAYFNITGDSLGTDTISVTRATGYVVQGSPQPFSVDPIHVRPYNYPSTLYTISRPQIVTAIVADSIYGYQRPLVAPLRVTLSSSNTKAFTLDSAGVTIPAGSYLSNYDTLRVVGIGTGRVLSSAPGSSPDSSGLITVNPTPLTVNVVYPGQAGRLLRLQGNYVSLPDVAPSAVTVTLAGHNAKADTLSTTSVTIAKGASTSSTFEIVAIDSTGTDSITADGTGFVQGFGKFSAVPAALSVSNPGTSHLTTEPAQTVAFYTRMRPYPSYAQNTITPVTVGIKSRDSTVIQIDSVGSPVARDSGTSVVAAGQYYGYFRIKYVGSGTTYLRISAPGFSPDSTPNITVTGPSLYFGYTTLTVGVGQIIPYQYVYVNNAVTGSPLVVRLARSDSTALASAQVFGLAPDSVIIPVGSTSSGSTPFDITGKNAGSALLIARATGYSQASVAVAVGQPRLLAVYKTLSLYVGAPATNVTVYTVDQANSYHVVAAPTVVGDTVSAPTIVGTDSAAKTIAARNGFTSFGLSGLKKGSAAVVYASSALGYRPDTTQVSVDTATLSLISPPNGLGPNQVAQSVMYVQVPFTAQAAITVTLTSSNPLVLTVPSSVTIPAGSYYAYFDVTGVGQGIATVSATASGFYAATPVGVTIGQPRLAVSLSSTVTVATANTLTVYAEDANGIPRNVTQALTVTLTSSNPTGTTFGASTITIPVGSSSAQTTVTFSAAGSYTISANASGYTAGTAATTAQ